MGIRLDSSVGNTTDLGMGDWGSIPGQSVAAIQLGPKERLRAMTHTSGNWYRNARLTRLHSGSRDDKPGGRVDLHDWMYG